MNQQARDIGARLRSIRQQQQLSLADVQQRSRGEWKAVVVGAYERGDRAVTVTRLAGLAAFYGVPVADLLPARERLWERTDARPIAIDLTRVGPDEPEGPTHLTAVVRFADRIRRRRGDHNGRVLTLRTADLEVIASTVGVDADELRDRLVEDGVLFSPGSS